MKKYEHNMKLGISTKLKAVHGTILNVGRLISYNRNKTPQNAGLSED